MNVSFHLSGSVFFQEVIGYSTKSEFYFCRFRDSQKELPGYRFFLLLLRVPPLIYQTSRNSDDAVHYETPALVLSDHHNDSGHDSV